MKELMIASELESVFTHTHHSFERMMSLHGEVYRELEGRSTQRLVIAGQPYFIKKHSGVGWREIIKNLCQGRLPIVSAKNEYIALNKLTEWQVAVPEVVAYGYEGFNPSKLRSFIMTKELPKHISLEDFCKHWQHCPPSFHFKKKLIKEIAVIARTLHVNGMNHRDFYICHFLLDVSNLINSNIKLYLIDLHRAQLRKHTPSRWVIKDLAGLYFSSKEVGLTKRDILRFIIEYRNKPLDKVFNKELSFWLKVKKRGDNLYRKQKG
jgi:tRNA A-37 threonylcarbamoyl transferase component Bud32